MRNFQDTFETRKRSFISAIFTVHDCTFKVNNNGKRLSTFQSSVPFLYPLKTSTGVTEIKHCLKMC